MSEKPISPSVPAPSVPGRSDGSDANGGGLGAHLRATRLDYEFADESGYRFAVTATHDSEFGWEASVTMSARGMVSADAAVRFLVNPAQHFIRMVAPRCACTHEAGDSPCPVHGMDEEEREPSPPPIASEPRVVHFGPATDRCAKSTNGETVAASARAKGARP